MQYNLWCRRVADCFSVAATEAEISEQHLTFFSLIKGPKATLWQFKPEPFAFTFVPKNTNFNNLGFFGLLKLAQKWVISTPFPILLTWFILQPVILFGVMVYNGFLGFVPEGLGNNGYSPGFWEINARKNWIEIFLKSRGLAGSDSRILVILDCHFYWVLPNRQKY